MKSKTWGILLASGAGIRMGAPKTFLSLDGKPLLWYSLQVFQNSEQIDQIGIVCRTEDRQQVRDFAASSSMTKVGFVVPGGKERQDSLWEGVNALPTDAEIVAIHDTARPLITEALVDKTVNTAREKGAALAAIPIRDTVKFVSENLVRDTLNRKELWRAQTPQAFHVSLLKKALQKAREENFYGTDCSSLVERLGVFPVVLEGSPENIKVTTPEDLRMAEALLSKSLPAKNYV